MHHPFTKPKGSVEELKNNPESALSIAYDMVLNGTEIGGGSLRINTLDMQKAVFEALGIDEAEAEAKFRLARCVKIRGTATRGYRFWS